MHSAKRPKANTSTKSSKRLVVPRPLDGMEKLTKAHQELKSLIRKYSTDEVGTLVNYQACQLCMRCIVGFDLYSVSPNLS